MKHTQLRYHEKFEIILYSSISLLVSISSNYYQQALNYAAALESPSLDVTSRVAISSNSLIYKVLRVAQDSSVSAEILSLLLNFLLTFLILHGLGKIYLLLKFSRRNSMILSLFSISSYVFASAIAYDVQVTGPITQARLTPILVVYLIVVLADSHQKKSSLKLYILITLALWTHLVIGCFLTIFTLGTHLRTGNSRKKLNREAITLFVILCTFTFGYLNQKAGLNLGETAKHYLNSASSKTFCLHYTNLLNIFDTSNIRRTSSAVLTSIGFLLVMILQSRTKNTSEESEYTSNDSTLFYILKAFYAYTLVITIILNVILIIPNPLSAYALGAMPLRFIDAANIFTFPVLMYLIRNRTGESWISFLVVILIFGRIVNARLFGFVILENEVHFVILFALLFILHTYTDPGEKIKNRINNNYLDIASAVLVAIFVFVQFNHQSQHNEINWKEIKNLSSLQGFQNSTVLTAPQIRFPTGINLNKELLSHSELQSLLYVRESEDYVNKMLIKYYSTNIPKYLHGNSCALFPSDVVRKNWTALSRSEWEKYSKDDHFSFVITPSEWRLDMKPVRKVLIYNGERSSLVTIYRP